MEFIDTHQHLIYRKTLRYSWTDDIPALAAQEFTLDDYQRLTQGAGITATLFMEAGADDPDYQPEARFIAGLIGSRGLSGQIASCRPEEDAGFDDWLDECEALGVKGYRRILHVIPDEISTTQTFRRNLRKIGARGLPFDLCFLARQHGLAEDLLRACDDQAFVLDHCGVPDIAGGGFAPWAGSLSRLAAFPHLTCKLSGITAYCAPGQAALSDIRPFVDHVLACFGPERILWGSDWPVANLGAGLPEWITQTKAILAGLGPSEATAIAQGTARRVYGL
jgi:predicted TIM-barrel fold metal-dependent hydrolase